MRMRMNTEILKMMTLPYALGRGEGECEVLVLEK